MPSHTWTNAGILLIGPLGTNFSEFPIEIHTFSFKKMHLELSSGKWRPFCLGLNVLTVFYHLTLLWERELEYHKKPDLINFSKETPNSFKTTLKRNVWERVVPAHRKIRCYWIFKCISWRESLLFWFKFHGDFLFPRVQLLLKINIGCRIYDKLLFEPMLTDIPGGIWHHSAVCV